jgi:hypothetical protein
MPPTGFQSGCPEPDGFSGLGKDCSNSLGQRQKTNSLNFKKMKSIIFSLVVILFTIFFTGCNDDMGVQEKNGPSVNAGLVQVKFETITSPFLKDGDDDDEPEPITFRITGTVTSKSNPVQAAVELVSMPDNSLFESATTDSGGGFDFNKVPSGLYNLVVIVDGNVANIIVVDL